MGLTKADAVFKHRVLWCAMADYMSKGIVKCTIDGLKEMILEERFPNYVGVLDYNCFLCTYARDCERCPLQDIKKDNCLEDNRLDGYYEQFNFAYYKEGRKLGDFSGAVKTALKIAFLPVIN